MTRSRRLTTWFGAGLIVVLGAPAAHAAGGAQPASAQPCGNSAQDFAGGFRDAMYPEVGMLLDPADNLAVVFYGEQPIERGTAQAGGGQISWTLTAGTYTSVEIQCADSSRPTRVTSLVVYSPEDPEHIKFRRA
jgi:hypothetical protein